MLKTRTYTHFSVENLNPLGFGRSKPYCKAFQRGRIRVISASETRKWEAAISCFFVEGKRKVLNSPSRAILEKNRASFLLRNKCSSFRYDETCKNHRLRHSQNFFHLFMTWYRSLSSLCRSRRLWDLHFQCLRYWVLARWKSLTLLEAPFSEVSSVEFLNLLRKIRLKLHLCLRSPLGLQGANEEVISRCDRIFVGAEICHCCECHRPERMSICSVEGSLLYFVFKCFLRGNSELSISL